MLFVPAMIFLLHFSSPQKIDLVSWIQKVPAADFIAAVKKHEIATAELNDAELNAICRRPDLVKALIEGLANVAGSQEFPEFTAQLSTQYPEEQLVSLADRDASALERQILEACERLRVTEHLDPSPDLKVKILEERAFVTQLLFSSKEDIDGKHFENRAQLPPWLPALIQRASEAKRLGMPTLRLLAGKGMDLTVSPTDRGLKVYLGLCQIHEPPEKMSRFSLFDQWLSTTNAFPYGFDKDKNRFMAGALTSQSLSRFDLKKCFKGLGPLILAPGWWALRFRYTSGQDRVLGDETAYFELKAGEHKELLLELSSDSSGQKRLVLK